MDNISKYLEDSTYEECGRIYKVDNFDDYGDDDVIYIGECGMEELEKYADTDITDDEIIRFGIGSSKNSIREELKAEGYSDEEIDKHGLIEDVFNLCEWSYSSLVVENLGEVLE